MKESLNQEKDRFLRYYYQVDAVSKLDDINSIVEVGNRFDMFSVFVKRMGYQVTTVDIDPKWKPDIIADVRHLPDIMADVVCCFETLEHIPYDDFTLSLSNLKRVASKYVIISMPDTTPSFAIMLDIPMVTAFLKYHFGIDTAILGELPSPGRKFSYDGSHYWEIGKRGYPQSRIKKDIQSTGMNIINDYRSILFPYHHYYVCEV